MAGPIEEAYFNWLCAKVMYDEPGRSIDVLRILHKTEFVWRLPGDENRAEDGRDLRERFFRETHLSDDPDWDPLPASIFEMMLALAERAEFQTDIPVKDWFWKMMQNLNLDEYRQVDASDVPVIEDVLYNFIWRNYDARGVGGLWPMTHPDRDQRDLEIWYQFSEYMDELGLP